MPNKHTFPDVLSLPVHMLFFHCLNCITYRCFIHMINPPSSTYTESCSGRCLFKETKETCRQCISLFVSHYMYIFLQSLNTMHDLNAALSLSYIHLYSTNI